MVVLPPEAGDSQSQDTDEEDVNDNPDGIFEHAGQLEVEEEVDENEDESSIGDRYSHHISNLLIQSCSWINKYIYTLCQHTNKYTQFRKKYGYKHTYK